nr:retrovirus-related Pol polyprotein from transposon TNT 1-94 [Tanacetum cinerariifolium]
MIDVGAENRPSMIDKAMYNSWESRMLLYIKGNKNGRMMLESIENGPLVNPTVEVDGLPLDVVTVQQVQGRQGQSFASLEIKGNATSLGGNNIFGQARVVKRYNYKGEGHMARQCTKPKRPKNSAWFKEKMLLLTIIHNAAFLTDDLDAYDSDYDDISSAKAVLMANLLSYGLDVLSMFKLDLVPLAPKLLNNKDAHIYYVKHSREHANNIRERVKDARALRPLDCDLDSAL